MGGGAAYAANTIFSSDIVDGQVKTPDLANGAVVPDKLADGAVTSQKVEDDSLKGRDVLDNTLKGVDIDESTLSNIGGGGPAGGDLTGLYPNPSIRSNAVGSAEVVNDSLTGVDIDESSLGTVPSAADANTLGGRASFDFVRTESDFAPGMPLTKVETDGVAQTVLETSWVDIRTTGVPHQLDICTNNSFEHAIPVVQYVGGSAASATASRDYDEIPGDFDNCVTMNIGAAPNADSGDFTIMVPDGIVWGSPWVQSFAEWDPDDYTLMGFGLQMSLP